MRIDNRKNDELRPLRIIRHYIKYPEGSVLIACGYTKVICTATILDEVPHFLRSENRGWITAEYGMIPRSTPERKIRDGEKGKVDGRTHEIQRLIGRSLRSVVDMTKLGKRTIVLDCDVIQADGGTRTAAISGSFVAMADALQYLHKRGILEENPIKDYVAAISVGIVRGEAMLDLCYEEDSKAEVDMNFVMTGSGKFVEIQGTAENNPFSKQDVGTMMKLAEKGIKEIFKDQKKVFGPWK
ncbi:MAG: ribonuclease PH [Candidatus Firestonebacteria bacterium]